MLKAAKLKTNHLPGTPVIDTIPYFSWILESDEADTMQQSFRIVIRDESDIVWDSGVNETDMASFVEYAGKPLSSRTIYTWFLEITDNHGNKASERASFETAFLKQTDWHASWIISPLPVRERTVGFGNQNPSVLFRKAFQVKETPVKARVYATCHGVYQLTVNGKTPDDRLLAPEYSSYQDILLYQTYDVTELITEGRNVLGMHVGEGWYFSPETAMDRALLSDPYAVLFQIELTYEDGSRDVIVSDDSVKVSNGPVLSSDLFAGEKYNANKAVKGWDLPSFDDLSWRNAAEADYSRSNK